MRKKAEVKKEKNNAIEFWRFLFTIVIVAGHINRNYRGVEGVNLIFGGAGNVLVIFLILSGYFLVKSYKSSKAKGLTDGVPASKQAARYLGKRVRRLYPLFLIGFLACFVCRNVFVLHNPISAWPGLLVNSVLEITGTVISGIGMSEPDLWFPAGWYISVLLVCGYLTYYLVAKDEDKFIGFTAPLICILVYGYWFMSGVGSAWFNIGVNNLICNGMLRGMAGLSLGVALYPVIESLKKIKFKNTGKVILTLLNAGLIAFVVWFVYTNEGTWSTGYISGNLENAKDLTLYITGFFITVLTIISLMNQDYITKFLNNKVCGYLGKLSIYMYVAHRAYAFCLPVLFPDAKYYFMMFLICFLTVLTAIILNIVDEHLIQPGIDKLSAWYKKATE